MQGSWLRQSQIKECRFCTQEFQIQGAVIGNGTLCRQYFHTEIFVTGSNWSITILNNPRPGFHSIRNVNQIPGIRRALFIRHWIERCRQRCRDFNDLVLTCRTPIDADDYLIYGHIGYYLASALILVQGVISLLIHCPHWGKRWNPSLKELISTYYPKRIDDLKACVWILWR